MKKLMYLLLLFIFVGCSGSESINTSTEVYEDDFVKFNYNPEIITNIELDASPIDYLLVTKLLDEPISYSKSLLDLNGIGVIVADTDEALWDLYRTNYKSALTVFSNAMLRSEGTSDEIQESDVIGKASETAECVKTLESGNTLKLKFISIDENKFCFVFCHIPDDYDKDSKNSLLNIYDNIEYKNPHISNKMYSDSYVSMTYDTDILQVTKLCETDSSYVMMITEKSGEFDKSSLASNSTIIVRTLSLASDFDNMFINNPELCATLFNSALSTNEITASDITDGICEKELSDNRKIKAKFLNNVNNYSVLATYSVLSNEDANVANAFEKAYNSLSN